MNPTELVSLPSPIPASFFYDLYGQIPFVGYDCPIVEHLAKLVALVAGSSICGARELCTRSADVVINWYGGWHHAQR